MQVEIYLGKTESKLAADQLETSFSNLVNLEGTRLLITNFSVRKNFTSFVKIIIKPQDKKSYQNPNIISDAATDSSMTRKTGEILRNRA